MHDSTDIRTAFEIPAIEKLYGGSFTGGNSVRLLWKNGELFKAIFDSIAGAERSVCLEFYIFRNDETGIELAALLKKKPQKESAYSCFMTTSALSERRGNSGQN